MKTAARLTVAGFAGSSVLVAFGVGLVEGSHHTTTRPPVACTRAANEAAAVIAAAHHREPYIERVLNAAWHHHAIRLMIPADDPRTPDLSSCR